MTTLVKQVLSLKTRPLEDLRQLWRDLYQSEPPPHSRVYLVPRLAYRLQELTLGGMKPEAQKKLDILVKEMEGGKPRKGSALNASPLMKGTTLVREWQEITHAVTVVEGGFEYQGVRYRSLSVIARKITGTHWSGPRFFGINAASKGKVKPRTSLPSSAVECKPKSQT